MSISHERLPDAEAAGEMKAWWRERLTELKSRLEGGGSMPEVEILPILVAAAAAFILGGTYYALFGAQPANGGRRERRGADASRGSWAEFLRGVVLAAVVAGIAVEAGIDESSSPEACYWG